MRALFGQVGTVLAGQAGFDVHIAFLQPRFSSPALANMMAKSIEEFCDEHLVKIEKITKIPLHGDGTIQDRVDQ